MTYRHDIIFRFPGMADAKLVRLSLPFVPRVGESVQLPGWGFALYVEYVKYDISEGQFNETIYIDLVSHKTII